MKNNYVWFCLTSIFLLSNLGCKNEKTEKNAFEILLKDNWTVASSAKNSESGDKISLAGYSFKDSYKTSVPATVMAVLVKNEVYKDVYFGNNLAQIDRKQFENSWWYRNEFELSELKTHSELVLEGVNYRANIWINGKKAFSKDSIYGSFRIFKLDITPYIIVGKNAIAIEILKPQKGEPTMGFVDWNPKAPDDNMGLWRPVKLRFSDDISVDNIFVQSDFDTSNYEKAELTIFADVKNHSNKPLTSIVKFKIENIALEKEISLVANELKNITFTSKDFKELQIKNPRLWWPVGLGKPELYTMTVSSEIGGKISDLKHVRFGIRKVEDYLNSNGYRGYKVNGVKLIIRGGGWVDDLLLADNDKKVEDQLKYIKHINLNTIRLEGFWGNSEKLYDLADEYGLLIMAGWSCQWEWIEYFGKPDDEFGCIKSLADMDLVLKYTQDHVQWLRNHPSIFVWVLGSDKLPRPELEKRYLADFKINDPSRPLLMSCKTATSQLTGNTGVKMNGPYEYVAPNYWYIDTVNGGAFGFNTETGPGAQPVPYESLVKMLPKNHLWPIDTTWNYHCGRNSFGTLSRYMQAFNARYGVSNSAEEFSYKSQISNFEAMRAMYEAFSVNKPKSTGIIQWMLNSAWPEFYWQLYDYYLMPNGAFYGAKTANRPLNIIYNYGNENIYVTNDYVTKFENLEAEIKVYNMDGSVKFQQKLNCATDANASKSILKLPAIPGLSKVYFVSLSLKDNSSKTVFNNFYWLSTKKDIFDFKATNWFYTPMKEFGDFTGLNSLPKVKIESNWKAEYTENQCIISVKLKNSSKTPALFLELALKGKQSGQSILPVFWDDNYISLMPGEEKELKASVYLSDLKKDTPIFSFRGWNTL